MALNPRVLHVNPFWARADLCIVRDLCALVSVAINHVQVTMKLLPCPFGLLHVDNGLMRYQEFHEDYKAAIWFQPHSLLTYVPILSQDSLSNLASKSTPHRICSLLFGVLAQVLCVRMKL
ncbi:hypothetical protein VNO77_14911 [Canavalia gladiata]|uniref:Uncharacterized protein n=1 Tax=Canavalia gladiata TaxID=3824 RepID=A0AAN9LYI2_CANGL